MILDLPSIYHTNATCHANSEYNYKLNLNLTGFRYFDHTMSTTNFLTQSFDDSEDEDDNFNPQPEIDQGDSDHEDDAGAQIQNEASRRSARDEEASDDEQTDNRTKGDQEQDGEGEDDEDAEGEGEDLGAQDEEDEEEEDDDEEEITVSNDLRI